MQAIQEQTVFGFNVKIFPSSHGSMSSCFRMTAGSITPTAAKDGLVKGIAEYCAVNTDDVLLPILYPTEVAAITFGLRVSVEVAEDAVKMLEPYADSHFGAAWTDLSESFLEQAQASDLESMTYLSSTWGEDAKESLEEASKMMEDAENEASEVDEDDEGSTKPKKSPKKKKKKKGPATDP